MFCSDPLLESIFGVQNADLYSKSRFLEPFRISRGPENEPRGDQFEAKGFQMASTFYRGLRLGADPAFHETTVILLPLGPSVFKNIIFFDDDWLLFRFFGFSLCYVLYVIFITFVEKTLVNAQPLSPPSFEKTAPDLKTMFFLFCFFTFALFILFHIFVNFRLPLPPPPGPDWSHLYSILVPFLFGFGRSWRTKQP
jgi:hypothetical protein